MKNVLLVIFVLALMGAGIWYVLSGDDSNGNSFGSNVGAPSTTVAEIRNNPDRYLNQVVTVEGEMNG